MVTTQRRDPGLVAGRHVIDVGLFSPAGSAAYLQAKLNATAELNDDPEGLAEDLGHLPLALAQAVAYMLERGLRCSDFRRRFASKRLPDLRPLTLPDQHRAIVAAIWHVSMELADQLTSGVATPVLERLHLDVRVGREGTTGGPAGARRHPHGRVRDRGGGRLLRGTRRR